MPLCGNLEKVDTNVTYALAGRDNLLEASENNNIYHKIDTKNKAATLEDAGTVAPPPPLNVNVARVPRV